MMIDNSIRKRWGFIPTDTLSAGDNDQSPENEVGNSAMASINYDNRYKASAQEWLLTWRTIE